jgi:hypothetical protein
MPNYELDSVVYKCVDPEMSEDDLILLVKEQIGDKIQWVALAKGWEYSLWYRIGERGGMAEAGELSLIDYPGDKSNTIEKYIAMYRTKIANSLPVEQIFERFEVNVVAWHLKKMVDHYYKEQIPKDFEVYGLSLVQEDADKRYFHKAISNPSDFNKIPINRSDLEEGYSLEMVFTEKPKEKQNFSTVFSEPSQYTTLF